jgi:uncharacterized protein
MSSPTDTGPGTPGHRGIGDTTGFRARAERYLQAGLWEPDDPTIPDVVPRRPVRPRRRTEAPPASARARAEAPVVRRQPRPRRHRDRDAESPRRAPVRRARPRTTAPTRPATPALPLGRQDDALTGTQPAGRVLVVMVLSLVLAVLINADELVARAERRPLGPSRDRALAIWHPVQDVSHAVQLYRVRQLADWVVGNGDHGGPEPAPPSPEAAPASSTSAAATPAGEEAVAAPPPAEVELRTPTPHEPLRLWVGGDSMAQTFGESLVRLAGDTRVVDPKLHYEISSGLTRHDYYDWPRALAGDVADQRSEVVVAVFGANDAQGIVLPDGTPIQQMSDPRWASEYRRRVAAVMEQLRGDDRLVVWVTLPPMRDPDFEARVDLINRIYEDEAATRPWVTVVEAADVLGDEGEFTDLLPDGSGGLEDVRLADGVHLTRAGGDRLAAEVLDVVEARAGLRSETAPRSAQG